MDDLRQLIRAIPDFPKPGIMFRDITPLVKHPPSLRRAVDALLEPFAEDGITAVVGMEARGFIFGSLAAWVMNVAFVPLRKPGKLPYDVQSVSYELEYGSAALEVHVDAVGPGDRVLLVDDLIATGGTAAASVRLIQGLQARLVGAAFLIELEELGGRDLLAGHRVHSVLRF